MATVYSYDDILDSINSIFGDDNACRYLNLDILFGFQDIDPLVFAIIAEILADVITGKLSVGSINALGNWFELVAQVISTYNLQKQYFEAGPGSYFNPLNKNSFNPYCDKIKELKDNKKSNNINEKKILSIINSLDNQVRELNKEVQLLQKQIDTLKKKM